MEKLLIISFAIGAVFGAAAMTVLGIVSLNIERKNRDRSWKDDTY